VKEAGLAIRRSPILIGLFLLQFVNGAAFMSLENLWQPQMANLVDMKRETWLFGLLSSISFFAMATGQRLSSKLLGVFKQDYARLLLVAHLGLALCLACLASQNWLPLFFLGYTVMLMISGVSMSPLLALFHREINERQRSTMLSVKSMFQQSGAAFGALVGHRVRIPLAFNASGQQGDAKPGAP